MHKRSRALAFYTRAIKHPHKDTIPPDGTPQIRAKTWQKLDPTSSRDTGPRDAGSRYTSSMQPRLNLHYKHWHLYTPAETFVLETLQPVFIPCAENGSRVCFFRNTGGARLV